MQITQCLHTAILVSDLEKAEHFYGTILGLSKVERLLKFPGAWYQVEDFQIHLIVDTSIQPKLQNSEKWGRNPHLALSVTDLDAAKTQLLVHTCPIQMSASGRMALFTQDPDGNIIELSQATSKS
jgi:glyoxylase I family protein